MIRIYQKSDLDVIINIWLEASIIAHDFIPQSHWKSKIEDMREIYIPKSKTYVYLNENSMDIKGFISLVDNYVAAIFISPSEQEKGIGKQLINYAKQLYDELELSVYSKNLNAIAFYQKQGFIVKEEKIEEHTGHNELVMIYSSQKRI